MKNGKKKIMSKFSKRSKDKLNTCHPDLITVFNEVIKYMDCTILEGVRTHERQQELLNQGKTKTLNSKHLPNKDGLSMAVDVIGYPIDWNDRDRFVYFAGLVIGVSNMLYASGKISHKIRSGIDWDMDNSIADTSFFDGPHFELKV